MKTLHYPFPILRPHSGVPVSNGTQGVLIWGEGNQLNLTVGRAGFWDHRGGTAFTTAVNFQTVKTMLEAGEEKALGDLFAKVANKKAYARPCQMGAGRVEIRLPEGWSLEEANVVLETGEVSVFVRGPEKATARIHGFQSRSQESFWLVFEGCLPDSVNVRPVWEWTSDLLSADGVMAPETWTGESTGGFYQSLPEDPGVALAWRTTGKSLQVATGLFANNPGDAIWENLQDAQVARSAALKWWADFRKALPRVHLPDPELQTVWDLHSYKLAGTHPAGAPAAGLQSAWMEDHRLPPWSNDYHFNINLQMMYWPCLGANLLSHFEPLWEMLKSWFPKLRENGESFFQAPGAMMLPHAVDDRCQVVGAFWSGTIDHACTAWVAQMAWLHYRHGMDESLLREVAWPLLNGAFEGFWAMIEKSPDGGLSLPVSVSPEYHAITENGANVWGRNSSFQLAACHMVARLLPAAARILGEPEDPRWETVQTHLPQFCSLTGGRNPWRKNRPELTRIALWENQDLDESHRHHSHLAGIYPFQTLDLKDLGIRSIVRDSLLHWMAMGAGKWAGWSHPWASVLCSRCDMGDAAVAWLKWWNAVFTDPHGAPLHDADFPGCGVLHAGGVLDPHPADREIETMQLDAGCGAVQAILELLVQQRGDVLFILPCLPTRWRDLSFDGVRVEGAFLVGATVRKGQVTEIRIHAEKGGELRFVCPNQGSDGNTVTVNLSPGERWIYHPANSVSRT